MGTPEGPKPNPDDPVVEAPPVETEPATNLRALNLRIRQQELLSELGVVALQRTALEELLNRAVQFAAKGLEADFCKVLKYLPEDGQFLLCAGVGWEPDLIGVARVGADLASPSGYALRTGRPVISNHLEIEDRFRTPDLLKAHGVRRAINVILQGDGAPFGVLEVDSRSEGEFSEHDIAFLQGAANILGMAIERQRYEHSLYAAIKHQKALISEINHRVKNSLQLVMSLFELQAATARDEALARSLQDAISRVSAVARIHERLYRGGEISTVDLTDYLAEVCRDLAELAGRVEIDFSSNGSIYIGTDAAVSVALVTTELVTNGIKHAYEKSPGRIEIKLARAAANSIVLSIRDEGNGLPPDFDVNRSRGLGMTIVGLLVKKLGAALTVRRHQPGSEFIVEIPITPGRAEQA